MAQGSVDSDRLSAAGLSIHSSVVPESLGSVVGVRPGEGVNREDDYNLGPLPPMWEKAFTPTGEAYFIDHNTGTSHWLDPRLARVRKHSLGECGEDELPYGWERVTDERYGSYYVDHINRRTQYENPVIQARRLRAEKHVNDQEGVDSIQQNGMSQPGELRGDRFSLTLTKGTQGLGFTLIGAEGIPEIEGYLQIRSIVPHSPAWNDGALRPGDVLVGVGSRGVRGLSHAMVAQIFQNITPGTPVSLHLVRGYPLSVECSGPHTRVLSTLAVEANSEVDAEAMQQLTRALRTRFNLDSPNRPDSNACDETDASPVTPHSPNQRRLLSRSFDLDELGNNNEETTVPPRCPSADHLLSLANDNCRNNNPPNETGRELVIPLRRGNAGFGFTIADSVHGQKVKKVLDRSRCAGLREGDLLLQIGETDVRHAPHQNVVQALKECPAMRETILRVWRRNFSGRAPRSRSATRPQQTQNNNLSTNAIRSKTPTAEQLRSQAFNHQDSQDRHVNGINNDGPYAMKDESHRLALSGWSGWEGGWTEPPTPTVVVDHHWRNSTQDSSDNGGFPEDGMLHSPSTAAISGIHPQRQSPVNRGRPITPTHSGHLRSGSPSSASMPLTEHLLSNSPSRLRSQSPSGHSQNRMKGSPLRLHEGSPSRRIHSPVSRRSPSCYETDSIAQQNSNYMGGYVQNDIGSSVDPLADVVVRISRGGSGFGFRIVGGTEDGSRVAVGYVVPGGPAQGLLRCGDLLTSVDGVNVVGATHAMAVAHVCHAANKGHVTLGIRHNRADIQPLGIPNMASPQHQPLLTPEPSIHHVQQPSYNILHPAPMYPPGAQPYNGSFDQIGGWQTVPFDVTISRSDGEGFGFVVISSTNKATSTIGQLIPNSPAARCGLLQVGDTLIAINHIQIRNLPHPEVVGLIKQSGRSVVLTIDRSNVD